MAGLSLGLLAYRRAWSLWALWLSTSFLLVASVAALFEWLVFPGIEWWLLALFVVVQMGPAAALELAAKAFARRRFGWAALLARAAAVLLGGAAHVRNRARSYSAISAIDRGDEARGLAILEQLAAEQADARDPARRAGALVQPPLLRRDWPAVLRVLDEHAPGRPVADLLTIEVYGACGVGDLSRALRALTALESSAVDPGRLAAPRRALLAAAGRRGFLASAVDDGLPVMRTDAQARAKTLARAAEAAGDTETAIAEYGALARSARGLSARDAATAERRCREGRSRIAELDEVDASAILDLEARCRTERPPPSAIPLWRRHPVTMGVSLVTLVVSAAAWFVAGDDALELASLGALSSPLVQSEGQWWRLFTTMLLHVGWVHLLMNVAAIAFFGVVVEQRLGRSRWLIVYVMSGLLASIASVYVQDTPLGVGASGAAMGLLGATALLLVRRPQSFSPKSRRQWGVATAASVVGTAYLGVLEAQAVDNAAHFGGLLAGAVVTWVVAPGRYESGIHRSTRRLAATLLVAVTALATALALRDRPSWSGYREVETRGASAEIPRFLHVAREPTVGAIASRPPFELRLQFGAYPLARERADALLPSPAAVAMFQREPVEVAPLTRVDDWIVERWTHVPERVRPELAMRSEIEAFGFHLVRLRKGRLFALLTYPATDQAEAEAGPVVERLRETLRAVERSR